MNTLNELIQNKALFFSMISVILATIAFIGYLIYRERKRDQDEIDDIMYSLIEPNRKPVTAEEIEEKSQMEELQEVEKKTIEEVVENKKEDSSLNIEAMLEKMQQDLNAKAEDVVATFEQEQEENSIISYQELVQSLKGDSKNIPKASLNESTIEESSKKEGISKTPVISELKPIDSSMKTEEKKFKNTDFISPIYGKIEEHLEYPKVPQFHKEDREIEKELETYESATDSSLINKNIDDFLGDFDFDNNIEVNSLEQTLNMKPISDEVKKNDEFLKALKEFRRNLD